MKSLNSLNRFKLIHSMVFNGPLMVNMDRYSYCLCESGTPTYFPLFLTHSSGQVSRRARSRSYRWVQWWLSRQSVSLRYLFRYLVIKKFLHKIPSSWHRIFGLGRQRNLFFLFSVMHEVLKGIKRPELPINL